MESFIPFIKDNDATPGLMVCILFTRAIERVLPGHTDPIVGSYVVNARPMLHSTESFHNCTSRVVLHYDESVSKMPLEKQGTVFREKTMLQSDEDAFIEELRDHKISFIDLGKEPISISHIVYQT